MKKWLTDKEKSILFSALGREKEVCKKVDKESCREPYEETLVSVVKSLEYKFYYDRLFKEMEKQIREEAIRDAIHELDNATAMCHEDYIDGIHFSIGVLEQMITEIKEKK